MMLNISEFCLKLHGFGKSIAIYTIDSYFLPTHSYYFERNYRLPFK